MQFCREANCVSTLSFVCCAYTNKQKTLSLSLCHTICDHVTFSITPHSLRTCGYDVEDARHDLPVDEVGRPAEHGPEVHLALGGVGEE